MYAATRGKRQWARRAGEECAGALQAVPGPSQKLNSAVLRRLRVLVAILRHGGHIARSARRMDWCSWCAAPCVRRVLRQWLLICSCAAPVLPARSTALRRAGRTPGQRSTCSERPCRALLASGAVSTITCRVRYRHELVSSGATWPTVTAVTRRRDGRFTPFLRTPPRALVTVHASWTRQPAPTLSAELASDRVTAPRKRRALFRAQHLLGVIKGAASSRTGAWFEMVEIVG